MVCYCICMGATVKYHLISIDFSAYQKIVEISFIDGAAVAEALNCFILFCNRLGSTCLSAMLSRENFSSLQMSHSYVEPSYFYSIIVTIMQQNIFQFNRPFRMGSIAFIAGVVIVIVSTMLHPSREDPANHPLVFMKYANSNSWVAVHIGQFVGGMMVFGAGFGVLHSLLVHSESSTTSALSWIGFAVAIMTASAIAILQAVDGIALKMAVDSWATAPAGEKDIMFRVAEGIRWVEYGTNSIFRILQGMVAVIFGVAIAKSMLLSRWIGGAGVIVGAISIIAGIEVAYVGFGYTNFGGLRGISMIIYFIWILVVGAFMWRKTCI